MWWWEPNYFNHQLSFPGCELAGNFRISESESDIEVSCSYRDAGAFPGVGSGHLLW